MSIDRLKLSLNWLNKQKFITDQHKNKNNYQLIIFNNLIFLILLVLSLNTIT